MITVGMNYRVVAGKQQEFEREFTNVLELLRNASGHRESHLYQDVDDPNSYLVASEWSDKRAFTRLIRSAAFKNVTRWGREKVLADRPRHRIYEN
jgi:heme-degrading monooxygenase HmoA